jgi:hypothetical protein
LSSVYCVSASAHRSARPSAVMYAWRVTLLCAMPRVSISDTVASATVAFAEAAQAPYDKTRRQSNCPYENK